MFSKANLGLVWCPIEMIEIDEAGAEQKQTALFRFRPLTKDEYAKRQRVSFERIRKASGLGRLAVAASAEQIATDSIDQLLSGLEERMRADADDMATLVERTVDWRVKTASGEPVPFSREFLTELLQFDQYYVPISAAFVDCCKGIVRKNSLPGPAGVQA